MHSPLRDVAQVRLDNALALFEEFVRNTVKNPDDATLRGLERRFAERLQIQPSYWSQIKSRSRQIGERLARQFEQLCHKPSGWMDLPHGTTPWVAAAAAGNAAGAAAPAAPPPAVSPSGSPLPQDDDERFIVGLVLTYYRRHPQRARTRLLDLLGEVLMPGTPSSQIPTPTGTPSAGAPPPPTGSPKARPPRTPDDLSLWKQVNTGVAPLKRKR